MGIRIGGGPGPVRVSVPITDNRLRSSHNGGTWSSGCSVPSGPTKTQLRESFITDMTEVYAKLDDDAVIDAAFRLDDEITI